MRVRQRLSLQHLRSARTNKPREHLPDFYAPGPGYDDGIVLGEINQRILVIRFDDAETP
jgi:hypothetical protein